MSVDKSYDGHQVVVHTVGHGESLSAIADGYRLPHWHSIWLYNTKVRQVFMGDDPDVIHSGDRIFIPRSPEGYGKLLATFKQLSLEMGAAGDREIYALEGQHWEYKAYTEMLDFAGDVATTLATFGLKAADAAKASKAAQAATGRSRIAAQYLADKEAERLSKWIADTFRSEALKAVAKTADGLHQKYFGKETSVGSNTNKTISTGKKVFDAVTGFSMIGGKFLLDSADIALSFITPSDLANFYLKLATGETVEQSNLNARMQVQKAVQASQRQLDQKHEYYAGERKLVYPPEGSSIGRYINFPPLHINVPRSAG
ncbi:MAG: hypothetical protein MUP90_01505 [Gammaproteobacteria bacterium]|nr:hypothetical protein [Gammaproteobacteria bacterium]